MDVQQINDQLADNRKNQMQLINDTTPEEFDQTKQDRLQTLENEEKQLEKQLEFAKKNEEAQKQTAENFDTGTDKEEKSADQRYYEEVFPRLLEVGGRAENLTEEERKVYNQYHNDHYHARTAMGTGQQGGGNLVPTELMNEIVHTMEAYGFPRDIARILATSGGEDLNWPFEDNRTQKGELISENPGSDTSELSPSYTQKTIKSYTYSSKEVPVSNQLLQDSAFNLVSELRQRIAERLGRITGEHFTTGDGSSKPEGVVTASNLGNTAAATNSLSATDWYDMEGSLDPEYRRNATWMFHDNVLTSLKKLQIGSSDARPLWTPGLAVGEPDTVLGYPYRINQEMASSIAADNKTVLFGDFSKFIIRDVQAMTIMRLEELRALKNQTSWVAFSRHDAKLVDPNAVKHMKQDST